MPSFVNLDFVESLIVSYFLLYTLLFLHLDLELFFFFLSHFLLSISISFSGHFAPPTKLCLYQSYFSTTPHIIYSYLSCQQNSVSLLFLGTKYSVLSHALVPNSVPCLYLATPHIICFTHFTQLRHIVCQTQSRICFWPVPAQHPGQNQNFLAVICHSQCLPNSILHLFLANLHTTSLSLVPKCLGCPLPNSALSHCLPNSVSLFFLASPHTCLSHSCSLVVSQSSLSLVPKPHGCPMPHSGS